MRDQAWTWTCEEEIPSEVEAGRDVLQAMLGQLEACGWPDRDVFGVHLSVEEALVNAIRHGNQLHPEKVVRFECRLSPESLWVQISDQGEGFDPADVPDPTDPEQLEAPSGRGIMLMRNFMSRVDFSNGGTTVTMEKQASPAEDGQPS
jgi:serine/threonine-protein kinase RsbW